MTSLSNPIKLQDNTGERSICCVVVHTIERPNLTLVLVWEASFTKSDPSPYVHSIAASHCPKTPDPTPVIPLAPFDLDAHHLIWSNSLSVASNQPFSKQFESVTFAMRTIHDK